MIGMNAAGEPKLDCLRSNRKEVAIGHFIAIGLVRLTRWSVMEPAFSTP
jgi:hypothetical protein